MQCFEFPLKFWNIVNLQILTNVPLMDMGAKMSVLTVRDHTHVAAERDML